jgi:molybdate transport system substrate-binding protein
MYWRQRRRTIRPLVVPCVLLAILPTACGGASSAGGPGEVTVFAASSLTESFTELGRLLERREPGTTVTFNFASSSDLAVQIVEGAPADVFASADGAPMDDVAEEGLVARRVDFATNRIVIVTPADDPAGIDGTTDLAEPGVKLVLAAPRVPAGSYAREALDRLGILDEVEANVVSNEEDVKAVVNKVALGEADAGIVYVTDLTGDVEGRLRVIDFPANADVEARYPLATLSGAADDPAARSFYDLVISPEGMRILEAHGFGPP